MPQDSWVACRAELDELISLLLEQPDYIVQDQVEEYDDLVEREPEVKDGKTQRVTIGGSLIGLIENLDNEVSSQSRVEKVKADNAVVHQDPATYRCPRERFGLYRTSTRRGPSIHHNHKGSSTV